MKDYYHKLPVAANAVEAIAGKVKAVNTILNKASLLLVPAPRGTSPRQKLHQFDKNNQTPEWIIFNKENWTQKAMKGTSWVTAVLLLVCSCCCSREHVDVGFCVCCSLKELKEQEC